MKVIHVIASGGLYGAEKWILALLRGMEGSFISSVLVNFSESRDTSAIVTAARERGFDARDFYTGGTFNPFCIFKFSRWLRSCSADIVHGHGYKSDFIGLLGARLAGCKMMSTPHGWYKGADKKLQLYERFDRYLFRFMDYVCPLSQELYETVHHLVHPRKLRLILNGVDIDEIDVCSPAFEKEKNQIIIGYIGRLVEGKDIPTLIAAFELLCEYFHKLDIKLFIVGDGEESEHLKKIVHDSGLSGRVEFLGFRSDAITFLKCFDVFVLPSLSEGIPRCIMETMAAGVPSVASDIPGNKILIEHDKTGFLFSVGDHLNLFKNLKSLIESRHKSTSISKNARELIEEKFSNKKMAEHYQSIYSILGKKF